MTETYDVALARGKREGAGACDDTAAMALFCDAPLQLVAGAVSPRLVFEGAQSRGMTTRELARMAATDPMGVADLMW